MTSSTCCAKNPGGQQEGEHGVVQHVQGEHYQRSLSDPVFNSESSLANKRSPKTIKQSKVQITKSLACPCRLRVWFILFIHRYYLLIEALKTHKMIVVNKYFLLSTIVVIFCSGQQGDVTLSDHVIRII